MRSVDKFPDMKLHYPIDLESLDNRKLAGGFLADTN